LDRVSIAVLAAVLLASMMVLVRAITEHSSAVEVDQLVLFYLLPASVAVGMTFGLFAPAMHRTRLALAVVSSGAALFVAEAALLVVASAVPQPLAFPDAPSVHDVVRELRSGGVGAYPTVPGNAIVDRDLTFTTRAGLVHPVTTAPMHATAVLCSESDPVSYVSDRFGFNNPDSIWDRDVEVAVIGDSYTHGICVQDRDQIVSRLRERWPGALNLGVRGAGPLVELAILREFAATVRPAAVVWIYYEGNDLYDLGREVERDWLTAYLDPGHAQALQALQGEIDPQYRTWLDSVFSAGFSEHAAVTVSAVMILGGVARLESIRRLLSIGTPFPSRASRLMVLPETIGRARDDVRAWGGELYFVYLPSYDRYSTLFGSGRWSRREVLDAVGSADVPLIDMHPTFVATGRPSSLWSHPRGHLNAEGYGIVASKIADGFGLHFAP
jgi:hypothetical protein